MTTTVPAESEWTFQRVMRATLLFAVVAFGFWLVFRFHHVIFLLFAAVIVGTVLRPVVAWIVRHGVSRPLAVVILYVVVLASIVGFIAVLVPLFTQQGGTIVSALPGYYDTLRQWLVSSPIALLANLGWRMPPSLASLTPPPPTGEEVRETANQALAAINSAAWLGLNTVVVLLLAFNWTLVGPRTIQSLLLLVPLARREDTAELIAAMETKVTAFVAGQGILCGVIAVLALAAYLIIGLPNALALALVAGVMEAVPMVGPLLGAIPAGVVALSVDPSMLLWLVISTVVIQQLENNLLVPRIMSRAVGVNPFVAILALFGFSSFFGLAGALMAIPIAAIIQLLLDRFVFDSRSVEPEAPEGRDLTSRLRYETRDFSQGLRSQARVEKDGSHHTVGQIDQVMDEIEGIAADLDATLAQARAAGE